MKEYKRFKGYFSQSLIYLRRVDNCLEAAYGKGYAFNKNIYGLSITETECSPYYILALLNSKALDYYYKKRFTLKKAEAFPEIQTYLYEQLPIPKADVSSQNEIEHLVQKITEIEDDKERMKVLENKIDFLVYHLYGLTYDEVLVVDPDTPITREEYEAYKGE